MTGSRRHLVAAVAFGLVVAAALIVRFAGTPSTGGPEGPEEPVDATMTGGSASTFAEAPPDAAGPAVDAAPESAPEAESAGQPGLSGASVEFRLESDEDYLHEEDLEYVRRDPRFQVGKVSLVTVHGRRWLEAANRPSEPGSEVLRRVIGARLADTAARGDSEAASVWSRVRAGPVADSPEQAWRTYLLEAQAIVTASRVTRASVRFDPDSTEAPIYVLLDLDADAGREFGEVTRRNVGRFLAIVIGDVVISAPKIIEPITGGRVRITLGKGTPEELNREARDLVAALNAAEAARRPGWLRIGLALTVRTLLSPFALPALLGGPAQAAAAASFWPAVVWRRVE